MVLRALNRFAGPAVVVAGLWLGARGAEPGAVHPLGTVMGEIHPLVLTPPPQNVTRIQPFAGKLWVLDGGTDRLLLYDEKGNLLRELAGGASPVRLDDPLGLSASGGGVALFERSGRILLFTEKGLQGKAKVPREWYPGRASFFTGARFFFTYCAWLGPGQEPSPGGRYATLLSSRPKGEDPHAYESVPAGTPESKRAGLWNAATSWTEWKNHGWAVCRSLPSEVFLFSADGRLLRHRPPAAGAPLPPLPDGDKRRTLELLAMDRVIGLVPHGDRLGLVWQQRRPSRTTLRVEWLDGDLRTVAEEETSFPVPLKTGDAIRVEGTREGWGALLIHWSIQGFYSSENHLYEWPFRKNPRP